LFHPAAFAAGVATPVIVGKAGTVQVKVWFATQPVHVAPGVAVVAVRVTESVVPAAAAPIDPLITPVDELRLSPLGSVVEVHVVEKGAVWSYTAPGGDRLTLVPTIVVCDPGFVNWGPFPDNDNPVTKPTVPTAPLPLLTAVVPAPPPVTSMATFAGGPFPHDEPLPPPPPPGSVLSL